VHPNDLDSDDEGEQLIDDLLEEAEKL